MDNVKKRLYKALKRFDKRHPYLSLPLLLILLGFKSLGGFVRDIITLKRYPVLVVSTFLVVIMLSVSVDTTGSSPSVDGRYRIEEVEYRGTGIAVDGNVKYSYPNEKIEFSVATFDGYTLDDVIVYSGENEVEYEHKGSRYSFTMPKGDVSIVTKSHKVTSCGVSISIRQAGETQYDYDIAEQTFISVINNTGYDYSKLNVELMDEAGVFNIGDIPDRKLINDSTQIISVNAVKELELGTYKAYVHISGTVEGVATDSEDSQTAGNGISLIQTGMNGNEDTDMFEREDVSDIDWVIPVSLKVVKKDVLWVEFPTTANKSVYGTKLKDIKLVATGITGNWEKGRFYWTSPQIVPVVDNTGYYVTFVPTDTTHYDYSYVVGYDSDKGVVNRKIAVQVDKADIDVKIPDIVVQKDDDVPVIYQEEIDCDGFISQGDEEEHKFEVISAIKPHFDEDVTKQTGEYSAQYSTPELDNYNVNVSGGKLIVSDDVDDEDEASGIKKAGFVISIGGKQQYDEQGVADKDDDKKKDSFGDIISVSVPSTGTIYLDPYQIEEKGQIYSDEFVINNMSDKAVTMNISSVSYDFEGAEEDFYEGCKVYLADSENNKILLGREEMFNVATVKLSEKENANKYSFRIVGDIDDDYIAKLNYVNFSMQIVFDFQVEK